MTLSYAVVIPARFKSSRLPGKPLIDLNGKPMIQRVWEKCVKAVGGGNVYVATDDQRIYEVVTGFGGNAIMTPEECLTGTDRIAYANTQLRKDFVINVQGDEPLINPNDIKVVRDKYLANPGTIVNAYTEVNEDEDPKSGTLPKVVVSKSGRLLYMSRAAIPATKTGGYGEHVYKQVCIYAFSSEHLEFFLKNSSKTPIEDVEDIEILRFIESDIPVQMVEVENTSIAVDVEADVFRVMKKILENE